MDGYLVTNSWGFYKISIFELYHKCLGYNTYLCDVMQINPFIKNNPIPVVAMPKKDYVKVSTEVAEDLTPIEKIEQTHYLYDQQRRVSLFVSNSQQWNEFFFSLPIKGQQMFNFIMGNIPENKDYIKLKLKDVRIKIGISGNSILTGLNALKEAGVITLKARSEYWVNPMYIFKGNRITYYRAISNEAILVKSILGHNKV